MHPLSKKYNCVPNISTCFGYYLRSADYVLKRMFQQGKDGKLDWQIVEAIVKEATKGPKSLDPAGDGDYEAAFFVELKEILTNRPSQPDFGALWVRTWDLTRISDVKRIDNFKDDVVETHGATDPKKPDRTYSDMPQNYDSTNDYW